MTYLKHERWIAQHLDVVTTSNDEFYCRCPFHNDSSPSFAINGKSGLWLCHGCHVKGNLDLLATQLGVENGKTAEGVRDLLKDIREEDEWEPETVRILPEAWLSQFDIDHDYWDSRGISRMAQQAFQLGYDPFREAVTVPLRDTSGSLLGVLRRHLRKSKKPRYLYPKGFHAADNLFGAHLIEDEREIALVEGTIDAIACWDADIPALAIYGSRLSEAHQVLLHQLQISSVTLLLDNDEAGTEGITGAVRELEGIGWKVPLDWPDGAKDPGDLNDDQIRSLFYGAKRLWHLQ